MTVLLEMLLPRSLWHASLVVRSSTGSLCVGLKPRLAFPLLQISFKEDKENFPAEATKSKRPNTGEAKAKLAPSPLSCLSSLKAEGPPEGRAVLSPASTNEFEFLPNDKRDLAMAKRVRRSYSRLETSFSHSFLENQKSPGAGQTDTSTPNHSLDKRHTLFGFEKLLVPDCVEQANTTAVQKLAVTVREPETFTEPDTDIPGICLIKEKKKKKKMPLFAVSFTRRTREMSSRCKLGCHPLWKLVKRNVIVSKPGLIQFFQKKCSLRALNCHERCAFSWRRIKWGPSPDGFYYHTSSSASFPCHPQGRHSNLLRCVALEFRLLFYLWW